MTLTRTLLFALAGTLCAAPAWAEQVVKRQEVVAQVTARLQEALKNAGEELHVGDVTHGYDVKLPDGAVDWTVELPNSSTLQPGRYAVSVTALVNGESALSVKMNVVIRQQLHVPTLKQGVRQKEILSASDLQIMDVEIDRPQPEYVRDENDVIGKEAQRQIRAGVPIMRNWLAEPLAVDRGDKVRVQLNKGGLSIETSGIAASKGRVGETIQVTNPASSKRYSVRITGPGEAVVE